MDDKPKDRISNGQFAPKHPKLPGAGRPKGSVNKTTRAVREFLAALVDDADIQEAVKERIMAGDAVAFFRALDHVIGKPKETGDTTIHGDVTVSWKETIAK